MRIGIVIPSFDRYADPDVFRRLVLEVETLGFDSAWFGDHIVFPVDRPEYIGSSWLDAMACANLGLGLYVARRIGAQFRRVMPWRHGGIYAGGLNLSQFAPPPDDYVGSH